METRLVYFTQSSKALILGKYKLCVYIVAPKATSKNTRDRLKNMTNKSRWDSKNSFSNPPEVSRGKYRRVNRGEKADLILYFSMATLNVNGLNTPVKRQRLKRVLKTTHTMTQQWCVYKKLTSNRTMQGG